MLCRFLPFNKVFLPYNNVCHTQRILRWVAIPFSRGSSWPRDRTQASRIAGRFFTIRATKETLQQCQSAIITHASLPSLAFPPSSPSLQVITEHQTGLPVLHSNFSPAIHLTRQCSFYRITVLKHCILNNTFSPRLFVQLYQELWKNCEKKV